MLPESLPVDVSEDVIDVGGLAVYRRGLSVVLPNGAEVMGAAAGRLSSDLVRADYELAERAATEEAYASAASHYELVSDTGDRAGRLERGRLLPSSPDETWRFARSNGVAIHRDWPSACRAALAELVERDRVLAAWRGETRAEPVSTAAPIHPEIASHDWRAFVLPPRPSHGIGSDLVVVGAFGFPKDDTLPFALGYAARKTTAEAIDAAAGEALQLLAFLWGEPLPESASGPPGPGFHLDRFQVAGAHRDVRRWLEGGHGRFASGAGGSGSTLSDVSLAFADLTPAWLGDGFRVAKCVAPALHALAFGDSPSVAHLPESLRIHPIA